MRQPGKHPSPYDRASGWRFLFQENLMDRFVTYFTGFTGRDYADTALFLAFIGVCFSYYCIG